jgi:uncharacterized protein
MDPATRMTCPKCGAGMRSYERNGVTVEQCAECRGLFLDRGELEGLIAAESSWQKDPAAAPRSHASQQRDYGAPRTYHDPGYHYQNKRRSFLEDLFG